jgi:hypothetical protein
MASIHSFFDWDFVAAEREFRRAIALTPNTGLTHAALGNLLGILGRFEEAIAEAARARALDPMSPLIGFYGVQTLGCARRFDDALDVRVDSQQVERIEATPALQIEATPALQWMDWQKQATTFEAIAAYGWTFNVLIDSEGSESVEGMVVTPDYFRVVGVQPMLGRAFDESDSAPPTTAIILGYDFWQRRFNGDPGIIGKTIRMSRRDTPPTDGRRRCRRRNRGCAHRIARAPVVSV